MANQSDCFLLLSWSNKYSVRLYNKAELLSPAHKLEGRWRHKKLKHLTIRQDRSYQTKISTAANSPYLFSRPKKQNHSMMCNIIKIHPWHWKSHPMFIITNDFFSVPFFLKVINRTKESDKSGHSLFCSFYSPFLLINMFFCVFPCKKSE